MNLSTLKTLAKAGVVSVSLAAAALVAAPVQAGGPSIGFSFGFGNGGVFYDEGFPLPMCMTDYQVRQDIKARGYRDVFLNVANGKYIQVKATKNRWVYLIKFNRCTGQIIERDRLHRA